MTMMKIIEDHTPMHIDILELEQRGGLPHWLSPLGRHPEILDRIRAKFRNQHLRTLDWTLDAFDPDEPRNERGEWTAGGAHVTLTHQTARTLLERAKAGGFTYQPWTKDSPQPGDKAFAVSYSKTTEYVTEVDKLTAEVITDYILDHWGDLQHPDHYLGAWLNPDDGKVYLDCSIVTRDEKEAIKIARANEQLAYFAFENLTTVQTPQDDGNENRASKQTTDQASSRHGETNTRGHPGDVSSFDRQRANGQGYREYGPETGGGAATRRDWTLDSFADESIEQIKAAGVAYVTPAGHGLFLKRSSAGDHPGEWCFPGGQLEKSEDHEAAARRESGEEIGVVPTGAFGPGVRIVTPDVDFTTFPHKITSQFDPSLDHEHTDHLWASYDDPPEPLHPGVRKALLSIKRIIGGM